jgi:cell wall-associated NlpC family hydrolase
MPRCLLLFALLLVCLSLPARAQQSSTEASSPALPPVLTQSQDLTKLVPPLSRSLLQPNFLASPFNFTGDPATVLRTAIMKRLGIRYRFYGADDNGYDCSGFVWRVFSEAGAEFQRVAARTLWQQFPAAQEEQISEFGTLVFFNGLKHVGIVRDAFTFYHASSSKGVTISYFAGYWEKRISGFRRAPVALLPPALRPAEE